MPRLQLEYLRHILDEAEYLIAHSQGMNREHFMRDETIRPAFVRSIEIIGEATKQVPEALRQEYPHVEWRAMAGMRDKLVHEYFGVDYDIVWIDDEGTIYLVDLALPVEGGWLLVTFGD